MGMLRTGFSLLFATLVVVLVAGNEDATGSKGEKHGFQAEVSKMLDIIINALYTNRDIFLREVISNGSDALDKVRFLYLTNPKTPKNDSGEEPTLDIRIKAIEDENLLTIQDGGVGMTKDDLINHLGSLGSSGTKDFAEKIKEAQKENLIGQFGVGFYSVFLVADEVRVATKHDDSEQQWVWSSRADGDYYIYEDPRGNTLGRGTEITIVLKSDAKEYLKEDFLKKVVTKYSEFIQFPIYLQTKKVEKKPVGGSVTLNPEGAEDSKSEKDDESKEKVGEREEDEKKDEDSEEKTESEEEKLEEVTTYSWDHLNKHKPIWQRKPEEVTEEEYNEFYKATTKQYQDPMFKTHFSAEGEVEFRSILFIPGYAPPDAELEDAKNIRLYVRRVFITDSFKDLLPSYLNFIRGVIDSDDLPLNVSRELLQESRIIKIIKKKLVRKALAMLQELADSDEESSDEEEKSESKQPKEKKYEKFWREFGRNVKYGIIKDGANRVRLAKLLRYTSSKSDGELISLKTYVDRMVKGQNDIYFLAGSDATKLKNSPEAEDAKARGVEVLFMLEAVDEYVTNHFTDYEGHRLVDLAKESPKLDTDTKEKKIEKARKEAYLPLLDWLTKTLGNQVTSVRLTERKTTAPFVVGSSKHGLSANMARIAKAQTFGASDYSAQVNRVLEVNYLHPIINEINSRIKENPDDKQAKDTAEILFHVSSLQGGFEVNKPKDLAAKLVRVLKAGLDLDVDDDSLLDEKEFIGDDEDGEDEDEDDEEEQ